MCKSCDYNSDECEIFVDPLTGDWYLDHITGQWDDYDDEFIHDRIYIEYCPFCGRNLRKDVV